MKIAKLVSIVALVFFSVCVYANPVDVCSSANGNWTGTYSVTRNGYDPVVCTYTGKLAIKESGQKILMSISTSNPRSSNPKVICGPVGQLQFSGSCIDGVDIKGTLSQGSLSMSGVIFLNEIVLSGSASGKIGTTTTIDVKKSVP